MKVCIRRGTKQIGGSAVEVVAGNGQRIVLDIGLPLDAESNTPDLLPDIKGLTEKTDDLIGILISHAHQDHYAAGKWIDPAIPVFMGKATKTIMEAARDCHLPSAFCFEKVETFEARKSFALDAFTITPYLSDHSAYDAYAFLIEADGRKLLYSGDFRAHGRKKKLFKANIRALPESVDVLLMEGSCLGREDDRFKTEEELEDAFLNEFKQTKGLILVQSSMQNIDRIVTVYRACKKTGRKLVLSGYAAYLLMKLENPRLPNLTWPDVKKFAVKEQNRCSVSPEEIAADAGKYVVLPVKSTFDTLVKTDNLNDETLFVWSMWSGYKDRYADRFEALNKAGVRCVDLHTSGHADIPALKEFVAKTTPKTVVPIHTFHPERFKDLFDNAVLHADNEVFEIE